MTNTRRFVVVSLLGTTVALVSLACHSEAPTPDTHGAPRGRNPRAAAAAPEDPMIVRIVGRHQAITVPAGPHGPLYSAATTDGKVIVAAATLAELRDKHPALFRQLEPSIAVEGEEGEGVRKAQEA